MPLLSQDKNLLKPASMSSDHFDELVSLGCGVPLPRVERTPVHQIIARISCAKPADVAVVSGTDIITYAELSMWAIQIATKLAADGVGPGKRIAVLVAPSVAMVAAVLGILQCGAAYVPLDQMQPVQKMLDILVNSDVSGIVTDEICIDRLGEFGFPLYNAGVALDSGYISSCSTSTWPPVHSEDPAYLIYTSGSTGEPKGVLVGHRQLSDSIIARHIVYPGSPIFLLVSPLAFDSAVAGLWGTLTKAGKLVIASNDEIRDPERLIELIERFSITQLLCVPSLYQTLLDVAERNNISCIHSLDTVIVAGEALSESLVQRHFAFHGEAVILVNEYGPTETTVWATYRRFNTPGPVSIGGPIPGAQLYILDEQLQLVPRGGVGELFIGGSQVSQGYFGHSDATERAFLINRFDTTPGARMYRTGDLVRWNTDGTLDFLGRRDHQVKIRGHRVELGAVEAALRAIPGIHDAIVLPNGAHTQLISFVLASTDCSSDSIRKQLALELPGVMVPAQIRMLDTLPLTISGKVDRGALSAMVEDLPTMLVQQEGVEFSLNDAQVIERIVAAWSEVLKLTSIPLDVNFFDLGGHSLMVFKLQNALEHHVGKRLKVVSLFRYTTVSAQAELICSGEDDAGGADSDLITTSRRARPLLTKCQSTEPEGSA